MKLKLGLILLLLLGGCHPAGTECRAAWLVRAEPGQLVLAVRVACPRLNPVDRKF